jgi:adenylosuccinate synthase
LTVASFLEGNTVVFGLQWGDEGKGKIVDYITEHAEVVVRYCGGANAGHTVRIGKEKFATRLLPVGIFRPGVMNLIGNGVVLDPETLFEEIDGMTARGVAVSPANLRVSYKTHLVMPYHKQEDAAREAAAQAGAIGTTKRGIGPTYADKMHRSTAIRVADLIHDEAKLRERISTVVTEKNKVFYALYDAPPLDWRPIFEQYRDFGKRLQPYVDDVGHLLLNYAREGKRIVFEGAHAALLDIDHGTFPFVTSSSCSALGLFTGAGVPPQTVKNFVGIMKSYSTRVGGGPFPTEQDNPIGNYIRERGNEYGTVTRRPRRCGWFDAVAARRSIFNNSVTGLCVTKLDVLDGMETVRICTGYKVDGVAVDTPPIGAEGLACVEPVYESLPGWSESTFGVRSFDKLPKNAQAYLKRMEEVAGAEVAIISTGPDREHTMVLRNPFD